MIHNMKGEQKFIRKLYYESWANTITVFFSKNFEIFNRLICAVPSLFMLNIKCALHFSTVEKK